MKKKFFKIFCFYLFWKKNRNIFSYEIKISYVSNELFRNKERSVQNWPDNGKMTLKLFYRLEHRKKREKQYFSSKSFRRSIFLILLIYFNTIKNRVYTFQTIIFWLLHHCVLLFTPFLIGLITFKNRLFLKLIYILNLRLSHFLILLLTPWTKFFFTIKIYLKKNIFYYWKKVLKLSFKSPYFTFYNF